jgi:hypothetical protein
MQAEEENTEKSRINNSKRWETSAFYHEFD